MATQSILIIDYEPRSIDRLRATLEAAGFEIHVARDGVSGIEAFNQIKPSLTLIEAMLPKRHGFEVCQELKKTAHGSLSPIVIITAVYKGRKYRTQALHHYGCDEYLEKPIADTTLLETVARLLSRRTDSAPPPASAGAPRPKAPPTAPPAPDAGPQTPARSEDQPIGGKRDVAEEEILEKLDAILPGNDGRDSGTIKNERTDDENIVSFDPDRSRRRPKTPPATPSGGGRPVGGGGAEPLSAGPIDQPVLGHAEAKPETTVRSGPTSSRPGSTVSSRPFWFWIALGSLAALAALIVYVAFFLR